MDLLKIRELNIVAILFILVANGCTRPPFPDAISTQQSGSTASALKVSQSPPLSVVTSTKGSIKIGVTSISKIDYRKVTLDCIQLIESQWGTEPTEFGYRKNLSYPDLIDGPYPPMFNEQGDMFIGDPQNHRILRYLSGEEFSEIIPVPESYQIEISDRPNYGKVYLWWSSLAVSNDRLFFVIHQWDGNNRIIEKIAILSMDGREQDLIDLEAYFPLSATASIIYDQQGGLYLLLAPAGLVHYDSSFHPNLVTLGGNWPYLDTVIGWDRNLYSYHVQEDEVYNWGSSHYPEVNRRQPDYSISAVATSTQIDSLGYRQLLGIDREGQLYFSFRDGEDNLWLARLDASGEQGIIGKVPSKWAPYIFNLALAPDGFLYSLVYDTKDISMKPKVVKCGWE
jgi:hypothetical protein